MNSRQLMWLGIAALAIILGAVWIGTTRSPSTEASAHLYPALKGQLAKVQAIKIHPANIELSLELNRTPNGWTLKQRNQYPADSTKINALLLSLESAKIREEKTSNPDNYAALGVQDFAASRDPTDESGARVELIGIEPPVNLIVGKADAVSRASYVRRAGEPKSWLVSEQLNLGTDASSWLKRDLLNIGADRIQEVAIQITGSPRYAVLKTQRADANFDVKPLPKNRELNSVGAANATAQSLVNLQLDDVRPLADLANVKPVAQTTFRTFDGLVLDVSGYSFDDKQWIAVKASFDEALAKRFHLPTEPTKEAAPTDTSLANATAKVRAESDALNKQLGEWAYAVAPFKYDAVFKPVDQLLRKP
jgi:hypothetical protein